MKTRSARASGTDSKFAGEPLARAAAEERLRQWMHEGLRGLKVESPVLAVGCEEAFLTPQLAEYSSDVTVLDTSGTQIGLLARRFPEIAFLQHNPASPLPFGHDTFEAIWCCEFLDRVLDPAGVLREMHRVLSPGGRLLVTVPDQGAVRKVLNALFRWDPASSSTNPRVRLFTRSLLARLAREAGFEDVQVLTMGSLRRIAGERVPRSMLLKATKAAPTPNSRSRARLRTTPQEKAEELMAVHRLRAA